MPKYDRYHPEMEKKKEKNVIHPVWRGIGCVLIVIIPVLSGFAANFLINNRESFPWVIIPNELILKNFTDSLILVKGVYLLIFAFIPFFIIGMVTFIINKAFGPSRGPYDVRD